MKLTTAVPTFLLAALASPVAGQELLGIVGITNDANAQTSWPAAATCFDYPGGTTVATSINVLPLANTNNPIRCTFFSAPSCGGDQITLNTGPHTFTRQLVVGSWSCEAQPQTQTQTQA